MYLELLYFVTPETLLKRLDADGPAPCFDLPAFEFEFLLLENALLLDWVFVKRTLPSESTLYSPAVSLLSTALLPPKNDVRCFRFLLARKAIESLPEVFGNRAPPAPLDVLEDLDDSTLI